ncbi:LysR family transcriptional regulator ArgP [Thermobifida halotolerans]|uniref:LysR family transcriptional regulator ArgP n=1 Tax=Thermobifida halotolerans TaxID=483545 RepID=A0A399G5Y1_9ACTN|nr:LysR family transcriptional regulator ArgP [Thermobifida halotolerans]UOE21028.1 LysR family transcriptional regulator ArgP [Thermobifida halotolerans]
MRVSPEQLAALVAVVDHGTFDAAARHLSVSPSAVSQRIRALESRLGRVVVARSAPCRPTEAGRVLLRLARQQQLLEREALAELHAGEHTAVEVAVAVNADSLATWFARVLDACASWPDVTVRLHVEDQDHSAALLRSGAVLAAVTSDPVAVQGCAVERLGTMRYLPVAAPALARVHGGERGTDWAAMPVVRFNAKDDLQHRLLASRGVTVSPPTHVVPSSEGFVAAVRAGLGWGMVPREQLGDDLATGRLVRLGDAEAVDVPLHWQCWRLRSERLGRVSAAVRAAAAALHR